MFPLSKTDGPRISIVTGIHGDELEGQYVCYRLIQEIESHREYLKGTVDIYPALNPLGIDAIMRGFPGFDLDMNRIFPGDEQGSMPEALSAYIVKDISGSVLCLDIHASNIFLREIPQIRISEDTQETLLPMAKRANVDFVWIHGASTVLEATLAHSLNHVSTPTLVVEMGVGMRLTRDFGEQLLKGIFVLMKDLGIWEGEVCTPKTPMVAREGEVDFLNAEKSGIFIPRVEHWTDIRKGELLGEIVDPLRGICLQRVLSPCNGRIFTLREYPVVDEGSLIGRIRRE